MKKLMLIAGMLAVIILANGCSEEEKKVTEEATVAPEAQVESAEATAEEAKPTAEKADADKPAACPKDCDKACCAKKDTDKAACPKDCTKPCCAEKDTDKAACPEDCKKPCCAKKDTDTPATCPKDCAKDCCAMVVTVNGTKVGEKEVSAEVAKRMEAQMKQMPPGQELPDSAKQQIRSRVVDMKVEQILMQQEMKKQNLTVSDDEILAEITKIAGQKGQSMEEVEAEISKWGMTLEDLKGQIRMQMEAKALMEAMGKDVAVSEADAQKFYDENPQHFNKPEQVKASHILCGKRGITEAEYPAELEKIEAAKARLDAGEAFDAVAKECSTCPSSAKGGDLGFFGKGQMDPAFEKAAFELEPGQTTGIVKTSFGYHIIKVTDKNEGGVTPFEEAKEQITTYLTQQKQRTAWTEYQKTMRDGATIEYSAKEQAARDAAEKAAAASRARPMPMPQPAPAPKPAPAEQN